MYVVDFLEENNSSNIREILKNHENYTSFSKYEFLYVIREAIDNNVFSVIEEGNEFEENVIEINKRPELDWNHKVSTVVSTPHLNEISINEIKKRNDILDLKECFRKVFTASNEILRISSPFIQNNILDNDAFPELKSLMKSRLENSVEIRIITREIENKRKSDLDWIIKMAKEMNKIELLKIVDYHIRKNNRIYASTHSKVVISDRNMAYVGSGELRKNSLNVNLEVGCLIEGNIVVGLCEIFDYMFSKGDRYV